MSRFEVILDKLHYICNLEQKMKDATGAFTE